MHWIDYLGHTSGAGGSPVMPFDRSVGDDDEAGLKLHDTKASLGRLCL